MGINSIEIYGKTSCPYCDKALDLSKIILNHVVSYYDISKDTELRNRLLMLVPNAKTVPQIFVNKQHIGGYDEFKSWCIDNTK